MQVAQRLAVTKMRFDDIDTVQQIEHDIFPTPWPKNAYESELARNPQAQYLVLRDGDTIVAYGGLWKVGWEAHVTTIGVRGSHQRRGYGTTMFAALIQRAYAVGARWVTLEVRASNDHAVRLYERFGLVAIARRRGYYTDNGEDAVVMWSGALHQSAFKRRYCEILASLDVAGIGDPPAEAYPQ